MKRWKREFKKHLLTGPYTNEQKRFIRSLQDEDIQRIDNDVYIFDPYQTLNILGGMGDGWVCAWENWFEEA